MDRRNLLFLALFLITLIAAGLHFYRPKNAPRYDIVINEKGEPVSTHADVVSDDVIEQTRSSSPKENLRQVKDYFVYFTSAKMDQVIRKNLESRMSHSEKGVAPSFEDDFLIEKAPEMIDAVQKVFEKFPPEFHKERWHLMNMVFEISQTATRMNETSARARDFFKWAIESRVEPPFRGDHFTDSNLYMSFMLYATYETDLAERRRVANLILKQYPGADVKKILDEIRR